jgi:hypothetical protein
MDANGILPVLLPLAILGGIFAATSLLGALTDRRDSGARDDAAARPPSGRSLAH